jgi:hypothetical protein
MLVENKVVREIDLPQTLHEELVINNSVVMKLNMPGGACKSIVRVMNSIIHDFIAVGRFFERGLEVSNCIFVNSVSFEAGGHNDNDAEIRIENNVFRCFVDFYDAQYHGPVIFKNNILLEGSSLLGNLGTSMATLFDSGLVNENNIGNLHVD